MNDHPDQEVAVFNAALRLPAAQRTDYLAAACAGEADLRHRVEALLQAHERAGAFLKKPPDGVPPFSPALGVTTADAGANSAAALAEKPGDHIGRYKLLQQAGEGGCGVVYMAEQEEPVRRQVAIKIIKLGMDTRQVVGRFEAERQALALMDHPNIAKVFDAGATGTGRPFFVMELVRGTRITDYCDQNNVSTRERLGLFIKVCQAIQHAHQKGIIHRDIKPSNILVTVNEDKKGADRYANHGAKADAYVRFLGGEFIKHGAQQVARNKVTDPKFPGFENVGRESFHPPHEPQGRARVLCAPRA